jgi:hypothetical protein
MDTDNIFTEIVVEMKQELADLRDGRRPAIPFMQERVRPREMMKRIDAMSPGQRREMQEAMGSQSILQMLRNSNG